jgi:aminopeptidase N
MEYKGTDAVEPSWNMLDNFIPSDLVRALRADESMFTHAIALPVSDPNEISSIFDDISYGKGSSVIRMLEHTLDSKFGPRYFFLKLHDYLKNHAYGNAQTADLWDALKSPDYDVAAFMGTWTNQAGFPFITVSCVETRSFVVEQFRFIFANLIVQNSPKLFIPDMIPVHFSDQLWHVPLSYSIFSNASGTPKLLVNGESELKTLGKVVIGLENKIPSDSILLLNYQQTGVYRSMYDIRTYNYLIDWIGKDLKLFPAVERAGNTH